MTYPHSPADFSVASLSEALQIDPASIASIETEVIGQGFGSLCQLARITFTYRGEPRGPKSVVAKFPAVLEQTRAFVRQFKFYQREVEFYRTLAKDISLRSPSCLYSAHDAATDDFLLLLEDLADHRMVDQVKGCSGQDAFLAVREVAALHAQWWDSPKLKEIEWLPLAESELNKGGMALYPVAWPLYLQQFGDAMPEDIKRIGERLCDQIVGMLDRASGRPRTICHGDYRLDNLFFGKGPGEPAVTAVDWQIAIQVAGTYDVGYFVSQSVPPALRREIELDLLRAYHDRLVELGVKNYSFSDCIEDYRWTLLFCLCYPVMGGGLGDLTNERGVALARAMTDRCVSAIRDWKAFEFLKP